MFTEGTRLKAVYQEVEGAPPYFLNWYDTELGVDCSFMDVGVGDQLVCFPSESNGFAYDAFVFTDGACEQPLVEKQPGCAQTRFFERWVELEQACGSEYRLFWIDDAVVDPSTSLYGIDNVNGQGCRAEEPSPYSSYRELHRLGSEIPLDSLVTGSYRHASGPGRIVPVSIVGSDGSVQVGGTTGNRVGGVGQRVAWDTARKQLVSTSLAPGHWYPAISYTVAGFSDAACSVPAVIGPSCGEVAGLGLVGSANACGYEPTEFVELDARLPSSTPVYYVGGDGSCVADAGAEVPGTNPSLANFGVGARVPLSAFALEMDVLTGTGQVQLARDGSSDGLPAAAIGFVDTATGQPCSAGTAADGVLRCLPTRQQQASDLFADAACTLPVLLLTSGAGACNPEPSFVSITEPVAGDDDGCYESSYRVHTFPLAGPYRGPLYQAAGEDCLDAGMAFELPSGGFFSTGSEVPPSDFAAVRSVRPTAP